MLDGPLALTTPYQNAGIFVGPDADNYVKVVVGAGSAGPQVEVAEEEGEAFTAEAAALPALPSADTVTLRLDVEPSSGDVTGSVSLDGAPFQAIATLNLPTAGGSGARAGIIHTHTSATSVVVPFDRFSVDTVEPPPPSEQISFDERRIIVQGDDPAAPGYIEGFTQPTSLALADGGSTLFVSEQLGRIHELALGPDYETTLVRTIATIADRPNRDFGGSPAPSWVEGRQVTGILPVQEGGETVLYVSHSDPRIFLDLQPGQTPLDPLSGTVTRLAGPAFGQQRDLVTGLPRSAENHGPNGMTLGEDGWIYLSVGGNTNFGAQSKAFGYFPEVPYSAAVVRLKRDQFTSAADTIDASSGSDFSWVDGCQEGESLDDAPATCSAETVDPTPGQDPAVPGTFELYAFGFRNGYDLVWHSNGQLYLNDNEGNDGFGLAPGEEDDPAVCAGVQSFNPGTPPDQLFRVEQGQYYGHPVLAQGRCDWDAGQPALASYGSNSSTNGIAEYTAPTFGGSMQGDLLYVNFGAGNDLGRISLDPGGDAVLEQESIATGFENPLDLATDDAGAILVAEYGSFAPPDYVVQDSAVSVLVPSSSCTPSGNPGDDSDGDGFTDGDEADNGTDPCSAASAPPDHDGDGLSNLNDPDDDNDGVPDVADEFQLDPTNGQGTQLPVNLSFNNTAGGFFGTGFPGIQLSSSGGGVVEGQANPGGAGGFLQFKATPGTMEGSQNDQDNAIQMGFNATVPFRAATSIAEPFADGLPDGGQAGGLFFGPGEDDFVRLSVHANQGSPIVEFAVEQNGAFVRHPASPPLPLPADEVALELRGNPQAGTITALYALGNDPPSEIATVDVPSSWFTTSSPVGLVTTRAGSLNQRAFIFDEFVLETLPSNASDASAELTVDAGGSISGSSTFGTGSFDLTNTSAGGQSIAQATIDTAGGPAMFPDLVFDPDDGTPAGDDNGKSFEVYAFETTDDIESTSAAYALPNDDGFDQLVITPPPGQFGPGDVLSFAIDLDPTSIKGASGSVTPGNVSGAELHGATLTVTFDDGSTHTTDLSLAPGSVTGSRAVASDATQALAAPSVTRIGGTGASEVVTAPQQTLRVTGQAGASGVLVVAEGHLALAGVPGFDLDPFEANTAVAITEFPFTLGPDGTSEVPVTLTRTESPGASEVGRNYATAYLQNSGGPGPVSDPLVLELSDSADTTPPTIQSTTPADGATDVTPGTDELTVTFSEGVQNVDASDFALSGGSAGIDSATLSGADQVATLTLTEGLAPGTAYTLTIGGDIADLAGNALAEESVAFSTADPDTTPPTIQSTTPADGATDVALGVIPSVTFSEAMNVGSVQGAVSLSQQGGGQVPVDVAPSAGDTVFTASPEAPLAPATTYVLTIAADASDLAGNDLGADETVTFTTTDPPPQPESGSLAFDGQNDIARTGAPVGLPTQAPLTISGWFRADGNDQLRYLVQHGDNDQGKSGWGVRRQASGQLQLVHHGITATTFSIATPANVWVFFAVVDAPGEATLHVYTEQAGWQTDQTPALPAMESPSSRLTIGGADPGAPPGAGFDGEISDVRVYDVARSLAQIQQDFDTPLGAPFPAALAGYWPLSDGVGASAADALGQNDIPLQGFALDGSGDSDWSGESPFGSA